MAVAKKVGTAALWGMQILAAIAFVMVGFGKFHSAFWIAAFPRWGYSDAFRYLIGVLEMAGGVGLAFPATASYAAVLLDTIMIGAAATLILHGERGVPAPIVWLVWVSIVGAARYKLAYGVRR